MAFRNQVLQQPLGQAILVSGRPDNHDIAWINNQIEQLIHVRARLPSRPAWPLQMPPSSFPWRIGFFTRATSLFGSVLPGQSGDLGTPGGTNPGEQALQMRGAHLRSAWTAAACKQTRTRTRPLWRLLASGFRV